MFLNIKKSRKDSFVGVGGLVENREKREMDIEVFKKKIGRNIYKYI